ncbi:MAG TPA: patatin-like phospholipase family protein [Pyrinomonadaceae bacterium]|jgi:predicted acylesterase/phospholipase RssA
MSSELEKKTAMILSGGGAYGAYEVGVMKALFSGESPGSDYVPINPGIFTGTSVGAFNAAVMTTEPGTHCAPTVERLESLWVNNMSDNGQGCGNGVFRIRGNPLRYLDPQCLTNAATPFADFSNDLAFYSRSLFQRSVNFLLTEGPLSGRALQFVDFSAFISVEPLSDLLERVIPLEAICDSEKELRIVATNWQTGAVQVFTNNDIAGQWGHRMIMASAAIPGIFPSVEINGVPFVDGGAVMNTPLSCAITAGATTLHVIYLDPDVANIPLHRLMSTIDTFDRVYTIMLATKINEDIDTAAWINQGLHTLERASREGADELSGKEIASFTRVAAAIEKRMRKGRHYEKLTIHRYHPHEDLGGMLGMLDFGLEAVTSLIERGYRDALDHDCEKSHCIFPDTPSPNPRATPKWRVSETDRGRASEKHADDRYEYEQ